LAAESVSIATKDPRARYQSTSNFRSPDLTVTTGGRIRLRTLVSGDDLEGERRAPPQIEARREGKAKVYRQG
jgi:hypothetical protein